MSEEKTKQAIEKAFQNISELDQIVELKFKLKPDHAIEILKLLEKIQNG